MNFIKTKVLIIGAGAAGLSAAWHLDKKFAKDTLLISELGSNSLLSPWNLMIKDRKVLKKEIFKAGCQMNKKELVNVFLDDIPKIIQELKKIGIKLKKSNIGLVPDYPLPGKAATEIFLKKIKQKGIKVFIGKVEKLLVNNQKEVSGVVAKINNQRKIIFFNYLIMAGGGLGGLFQYTTGSKNVDGSLLALAYEAGLTLENIEFFMFHPFLIVDQRLPHVLISGSLLSQMEYENENEQPFLSEKVATALRTNQHHYIFPEMVKEFYLASLKNKKIFGRLVCSNKWFEKFKKENEFGYIFKNFTKNQLKKIEIHPAFHYTIGGLSINKNGQTSQKNIYAAGEIAGGLHGANRIGGLAILEALVFGKRAALDINRQLKKAVPIKIPDKFKIIGRLEVSKKTKELAWQCLGPIKNDKSLKKFNRFLRNKKMTSQEKLLKKIVEIALLRKNSIGAFIKEKAPLVFQAKSSFVVNKQLNFK